MKTHLYSFFFWNKRDKDNFGIFKFWRCEGPNWWGAWSFCWLSIPSKSYMTGWSDTSKTASSCISKLSSGTSKHFEISQSAHLKRPLCLSIYLLKHCNNERWRCMRKVKVFCQWSWRRGVVTITALSGAWCHWQWQSNGGGGET